jgi:hypothetical protein
MEYLYNIHTKLVDDKIHYFVKKMMTFPEFKGLANVVVGYGMHTDFEKACSISGIHDIACRKQLLSDLEQRNQPKLPNRQPAIHTTRPQKTGQKHTVQIPDMVNRWLAQRGAELLN